LVCGSTIQDGEVYNIDEEIEEMRLLVREPFKRNKRAREFLFPVANEPAFGLGMLQPEEELLLRL
jgi:hypothetical protein